MRVLLCCGCGKKFPENEVQIFFIPLYTCAVTRRVFCGFAKVAVCRKCLSEKGKPVKAFYRRIHWENGDVTSV